MKTIGLIPARYQSSRFPGKPLVKLLGKPMIIWVAQLTAEALGKENVYVATDSEKIKKVVEDFGFSALMSSKDALTGTDRLWEAAQQVKADIYVNVQGDEPLLNPIDIINVVEAKKKYMGEVINAMCPILDDEDPRDVNIPKVVVTQDKRMVYMSRLAVPGTKSLETAPKKYWKQVCIYAFNYNELKAFGSFGRKSYLESFEDIEILRFLELNIPVRMVESSGDSRAVDIPEDVAVVEKILKRKLGNGQ